MIKHAAIRRDGIVYVGKRHHDCIAVMVKCGIPKPVTRQSDGSEAVQGFVDDRGNFLNRRAALKAARNCGQIIRKHGSPDELYSEDLY